MSGSTPNLDLEYLDPSQAQPEVKINDAWDKIDAVVGSGLTVEDLTDSPHVTAPNTRVLRFTGARVTQESDGVVLIEITTPSGGGSALTVQDFAESPGRTVIDVATIRFIGAEVTEESGGVALVTVPTVAGPQGAAGQGRSLGAYFTTPGGGALGLPVNAVEALVNGGPCSILEVLVLTKGGPGSCTVKLWKANLSSHYPPVSADDISGGTNVVISSGTTYQNSTLTGWTTSLAADDVILITLSATSSFTSVAVYIRVG